MSGTRHPHGPTDGDNIEEAYAVNKDLKRRELADLTLALAALDTDLPHDRTLSSGEIMKAFNNQVGTMADGEITALLQTAPLDPNCPTQTRSLDKDFFFGTRELVNIYAGDERFRDLALAEIKKALFSAFPGGIESVSVADILERQPERGYRTRNDQIVLYTGR